MQDLRIEVDVYCEWQTEPQAHRLYIDNDLYTERTYIWRNPHQWVREILVAELDSGEHNIRIESINKSISPNIFRMANFSINNKFYPLSFNDTIKHRDCGKFVV